jgi:hypothetical protein
MASIGLNRILWFYAQVKIRARGITSSYPGTFKISEISTSELLPQLLDGHSETALRGAGAAHWIAGNKSTGVPWGGPHYGDDPRDQVFIPAGYRYAQALQNP